VTVPLGTVLGLESTPGEVTGWGLLDAEACRELAADGAWRRWLTDPATGELLDVGAREYVPSAALARFVRGRDRSCRWPGCAMPAVRCDLDHREPFDHAAAPEGRDQPGPTVRDNLDPLCRRHHRIKTATAWVSTRQAAGPSVWTSPCGRHYTQPNEPVVDATLDVEAPAQLEEADLRRSPQPKARQKVEVKERVPAMSAAGPVGSWNELDDLPDSYRGDPPF
jgi:hypothetical protein